MPELPEVETTRRGVEPELAGQIVTEVVVRNSALRYPVPVHLPATLAGQRLLAVRRRGKYLLFVFDRGTLMVHLGMSGSLRVLPRSAPPQRHDHLDIAFGSRTLRYRDPRRFGLALWVEGDTTMHPLLAPLGLEPDDPSLDGDWLHSQLRSRSAPVKQVIMDSHLLVGVGNIYANESLFRAGIRPQTPARKLSLARCSMLVKTIRETLQDALAAGGSSLRDFVHSDGQPGYFQQQYFVYDRDGDPCRICGSGIKTVRMAGRSTYFCPKCQR